MPITRHNYTDSAISDSKLYLNYSVESQSLLILQQSADIYHSIWSPKPTNTGVNKTSHDTAKAVTLRTARIS